MTGFEKNILGDIFDIHVFDPIEFQPEGTILAEYEFGSKDKKIKRLYASKETMQKFMEAKLADGNYTIGV